MLFRSICITRLKGLEVELVAEGHPRIARRASRLADRMENYLSGKALARCQLLPFSVYRQSIDSYLNGYDYLWSLTTREREYSSRDDALSRLWRAALRAICTWLQAASRILVLARHLRIEGLRPPEAPLLALPRETRAGPDDDDQEIAPDGWAR